MQSDKIDGFRKRLLQWYGKHRRPYPWRMNPTPYRVWISEIMLQQTQAKSAIPYFNRFLKRFPDIASLAHASEEEILVLWSGLGYYNRARNLLKAAQRIVEFHNGIFPTDHKTALSLPGIGPYTAGAICSIAFNQTQPVVDGNIRRVISRLNGIRSRIPEKYFWHRMAEWIPEKKASSFNQAMMELGAVVCLPSQPLCRQCPVPNYCVAKNKNLQNTIPQTKPRKTIRKVDLVILIIERDGEILLIRQEDSFIPGKWGFPYAVVSQKQSPEESAEHLRQKLSRGSIALEYVSELKHSITNRRISVHIFVHKTKEGTLQLRIGKNRVCWANDLQQGTMLTSSLYRKALQELWK